MVKAEDMIRIARREVGYTEEPTNITKYWTFLTNADWFDGMNKQGGEWCGGFVCALALEATGSKAEGRRLLCQTGPLAACCDDAADYYRQQGRWFKTPAVGDQIFFDYDPERGNGEDHTGIVESIDGTVITTIEGNSHDKVSRNVYSIYDKSIAGFGRPLYDDSSISPSTEEKPHTDANRGVYEVQSGDTLSEIAEKLNCSISDLIEWNGIANPDRIYVGQALRIRAYEDKVVDKKENTTYTVRSGDTLGEIAERYHCDVDELAERNGIKNKDLIYPGQIITI